MPSQSDPLAPTDSFARRHSRRRFRGHRRDAQAPAGFPSVDALAQAAVPAAIRRAPLRLPPAAGESAALAELRSIAVENRVFRSFIGLGYHGCHTPSVIRRTVFENPGMVHGLHPLPGRDFAGTPGGAAQLPDDGLRPHGPGDRQRLDARRGHRRRRGHDDVPPAEGRAMRRRGGLLCLRGVPPPDDRCRQDARQAARFRGRRRRPPRLPPRTGLLRRARPVPGYERLDPRFRPVPRAGRAAGALGIVAADLLALTLLRPPGRIRRGCRGGFRPALRGPRRLWRPARRRSSRPGTPSSARCPAGWSASRRTPRETLRCALPWAPASSTSAATRPPRNICTAQVLLAVMASMYAVYHGPVRTGQDRRTGEAPRRPARGGPARGGVSVNAEPVFDTLPSNGSTPDRIHAAADATADQSPPHRRAHASESRSTRRPRRPMSRRSWRPFGAAPPPGPGRTGRSCRRPMRGRPPSWTTRFSTSTTQSTGCSGTSSAWRRRT